MKNFKDFISAIDANVVKPSPTAPSMAVVEPTTTADLEPTSFHEGASKFHEDAAKFFEDAGMDDRAAFHNNNAAHHKNMCSIKDTR